MSLSISRASSVIFIAEDDGVAKAACKFPAIRIVRAESIESLVSLDSSGNNVGTLLLHLSGSDWGTCPFVLIKIEREASN